MLNCLSVVLRKPRALIQTMYDTDHPDWIYPIGDVNTSDIPNTCPLSSLTNTDGIQVRLTEMRYYYAGGVASNVVGYTRKPSAADLAAGYGGDQQVGANGLELSGENYLAGRSGGSLLVTSSNGTVVSTLAKSTPLPAMDIYTTLDRDLQAQMERTLMEPFTGAAVVLDRNTGEVLAMLSSPRYDSNYFNPQSFNGTQTSALANILSDPRSPLLNRAAQGLYPLGSVFKIITMSAALQSNQFDANSIAYDDETGYFTELEGFNGTDWTVEREMKPQGKVSLTQCLERSTNTCFWHVALNLYYKDAWLVPNMAAAFGLGQKTGIVGVDDEAGLLPNPGWKHDTGGGDWTGLDALNQAIGQGSLQVTPLQVADFVAAVGNGGTLYRPQILSSIRPQNGDPVFSFAPDTRGSLPVSAANLLTVQRAMEGVVLDLKGTAYSKFHYVPHQYKLAGKTGTAQTEQANPDAWFVAYSYDESPDKPDIAVAVIVENVGEGATYAAPMVRRIMEIYFDGRPESLYPWESTYGMRGTDTPVESETPTETPTETPEP
jgi:penicillin-binding protein 2